MTDFLTDLQTAHDQDAGVQPASNSGDFLSQLSDAQTQDAAGSPSNQKADFAGALGYGIANAVPFSHDIGAGIQAAESYLPKSLQLDDTGSVDPNSSFGQRFTQQKARINATDQANQEQYPITSFVTPLATSIAALPVAGPIDALSSGISSVAPRLGGLAADSLASGAVGAGYGAAYGAGTGDSLDERLANAKSGALWGGVGGAAAPTIGKGINVAANALNPWNLVKSFRAPMTSEGQSQLAGQTLRDAATDPNAALSDIENNPRNLVPGSDPTTFQLTGDMGLGSLERRVQTQNPDVFQNVRARQNQARLDALGNIQSTGSPEDVSAALRDKLNTLSTQMDADATNATTNAQVATTALGGDQSPAFYGNQIKSEIQPKLDAATQNAANTANAIGGNGTPENYGAALREPLQGAKIDARDARSALYRAVDPDGSLNVVAAPLRDAAGASADKLSKYAAQPSGEEAAILSSMQSMPDVVPFSDLQALDARISAAMSAERRAAGETPIWQRLTQMKGATQDAIDNGVANQVAYERVQSANGTIAPENTIESRLKNWQDDFYAQQQASQANIGNVGQTTSSGAATNARVLGAKSPASGGSGNNAGNAGVPPALEPNFDPAAAQRLAAAEAAHADYAQTYRQGTTGQILKTNGYEGQYVKPNAAVPDQVFAKGPKGYELGTAYRKAVNNDPAAIDAAHNYAAMTLRRMAQREDGTIDPAKFSAWKNAYGDALRAFPGLDNKFSTTARASQELDKFAPFKADMAPFNVPEVFFHSGKGGDAAVSNLRRLVGDNKANSILSEYAASKLKSTPGAVNPDGTLNSNAVRRFQQTHAEALKSFPALNNKFSTAANATETANGLAQAQKKSLDAFQAGAVGKIMNASPDDVVNHVGAIFGEKDGANTMARLATEAQAAGPNAVAGLRKAIAAHIVSKFVSNTEAGTSQANLVKSDAFQTFMKTKTPILSKVFSPKEIASMQAVADDLNRGNRSVTAVRIPGQSNTAQDLTAVKGAEHGGKGSLLNAMVGGGLLGHEAGGLHGMALGAASGVIKHVISVARAAGYGKVDELVRDAMIDPDKAAFLMRKAPIMTKGDWAKPISSIITKGAAAASAPS